MSTRGSRRHGAAEGETMLKAEQPREAMPNGPGDDLMSCARADEAAPCAYGFAIS
jgi:hypothetical protein